MAWLMATAVGCEVDELISWFSSCVAMLRTMTGGFVTITVVFPGGLGDGDPGLGEGLGLVLGVLLFAEGPGVRDGLAPGVLLVVVGGVVGVGVGPGPAGVEPLPSVLLFDGGGGVI
jgi:hypothetical protein